MVAMNASICSRTAGEMKLAPLSGRGEVREHLDLVQPARVVGVKWKWTLDGA